ncbi:MAG: VCBS repeat-containing protein, partial [bacterium]|nr:VCBS repeat-containing protein [bacterium]
FDDFFGGTGITGTPCDSSNEGDPIVLYDRYAQRWFLLDFAWASSETDGSYFSIAVSKTSDPTGDWWQYAFRADATLMDDYPKCGIWHDGIYITANMFSFAGGFQHVKIWALQKPDIYSGTLNAQYVTDSSFEAWSILPSNAVGDTAPPAGAPNYMYGYDADEWGGNPSDILTVWKYDVDWSTPGNTAWTGPVKINTAAFSLHSSNIRQQGTANKLDTLYSRLMYPATYRNFSTHESVYLCHLVDVGGIGCMRWYEVRISGGTSSIYQQGTYNPDSHHRWMGSIAGDKDGNIAMGYSVSSSSMYPAIRYAGRLSTDPLNVLSQGEATLIDGTGSQSVFDRWGDYSQISIDPSDDETFWYTTEYLSVTGTNWQTRIGSFKMATSTSTASSYYTFHGSNYNGTVGAEFAVFRPADGSWRVSGSSTVLWGTSTDIPVPGNYDGDSDTDIAIFRPSTGRWAVRGSASVAWGTSTDIPVPGDYDGDGDTDFAVFRPSDGSWRVSGSSTVLWGTSTDIPVPGDYDGDGDTDMAVFRPGDGSWRVRGSSTVLWGTSTDIPVPADYDGDGDTDMAIFRPSTGRWAVRGSASVAWGTSTDIPVPADYDGDGTADIAIFRPSTGRWAVLGTASVAWGTSTDIPLVSHKQQ